MCGACFKDSSRPCSALARSCECVVCGEKLYKCVCGGGENLQSLLK